MARAIRNPENFVSTLYHVGFNVNEYVQPANTSGATVREILAEIAAATQAYQRRQFNEAVQHYKTAQSLAYRLLYPQHRPSRFIYADDLVLPVSQQLERHFAEAAVKLIEAIQPDVKQVEVPIRVANVQVPDDVQRFSATGFRITSLVGDQLEERIQFGTELIAKGQPDRAAEVLSEVVKQIDEDASVDSGLRSTALLNLSTAFLANGDTDGAVNAGKRAAELFANGKDTLGQAQALHNIGVAMQTAGNENEAKNALTQASTLYREATTSSADAGDATTPTPGGVQPGRLQPTRAGIPVLTPLRPVVGDRLLTSLRPSLFNRVSTTPQPNVFQPDDGITSEIPRTLRPTLDVGKLSFIEARDTSHVSIRWVGDTATWSDLAVDTIAEPIARRQTWQVGIPVGDEVATLQWQNGSAPTADNLLQTVYQARIDAVSIQGLRWYLDSEAATSAYLAHVYGYVIPVGLGDCYHELGNYERAETYYLQAANYSYINRTLEVPNLWVKIANNIREWGDRLYKDEDIEAASAIYGKLMTQEGRPADDQPLFAMPIFEAPAAEAREALGHLRVREDVDINPAIATPLMVVFARWQYIVGGLDFFGLTFTPIFTFEYLQDAARAFAQQSIQAEREYVNFQVQAEAESAARRDLENALAMSQAETQIQLENARAASDDRSAAQSALNLASLRAQNAAEDRERYRDAGYWQYVSQSIATAHSAHEDWHGSEIRALARDMENGSWEGKYGKLAAAATLLGGQKSYEYQLSRLQNAVEEMNATIPIAQAQTRAAEHRENAAWLQYQAANQRHNMLEDSLAAFENEVFTPELWHRMAIVMRNIAHSYQNWAIGIAKLMERAYNFETDNDLHVIRSEYSISFTDDLLGSDYLLRDIDSFTYHYITHTVKKESRLKDVISLRNEYPFHFYEFQETGRLSFETLLHDFDMRHPGFYSQRLQAVEVEVIGLLPPEGVRGMLRGGIASHYRTVDGNEKTRVHAIDTLALSEYTTRGDAYIFRTELNKTGLFEGHGVSTTWLLDLPRAANNLDYRLITDVRLVLYYSARHNSVLQNQVMTQALLAGEGVHVRDFAMRYDFPEVWYGFLHNRQMQFTVDADYLPRNETNFTTDKVAVRLIGADGVSVANVPVTITLPGQAALTMNTDANGAIAAENNNAFQQAMGGAMLGDWSMVITPAADSPLLNEQGTINPAALLNIAIVVQYAFEYRQ